MHALLAQQLRMFDADGLPAAVDASYAGYDDQLRQLRQELADTRAQLRQAGKLAALGEAAAGIVHEINNPLGYLNANFGVLQEYLDELQIAPVQQLLRRELQQLLDESQDGLQRVLRIVRDLKDFSRTDEGQDWQWADLHQGMDATLNILAGEIKYRADVVREYGQLPPMQCLPSQLNQVLMNLVINAAQAISGPRGTITLRTGTDGGEAWFSVSDTGNGIAADALPRIFEPFFTTKPAGVGTGLGLPLSRDIVRRHGGRIEVQTEAGRGTTFRVALPLRRPSATTAQEAA
jgi:signal transduction histidine kinase